MKKIIAILLLVSSAFICFAESVVMQRVLSCYVPKPGKAQAVLDGKGGIKFTGEVKYSGKFDYLIARVKVKPFKLTGKSLVLNLRSSYCQRDAFYVKAINAAGKAVASFVTFKALTDWNTMVCTPDSSKNGVTFIARDIKGDPNEEVTSLNFYFCRRGPAADFNAEISSITLVPRVKNSSVSPTPQSEPGMVKLYRVSRCVVPNGKASAVISQQGEITAQSEVKFQKYNYLIADVEVRPFIIAGNSLALVVQSKDYLPGDGFYVKGFNAANKVVASFCIRRDIRKPTQMVCTPGSNSGNATFIARDVKAPEDSPIVKLRIYYGRRGPAKPIEINIKDIKLIKRPPKPVSTGFVRYGVGIASAEVRNFIAFRDEKGRRFILCNPDDEGNVSLLLTEVDTGRTTQYYTDKKGAIFGGVLTSRGKYVYGFGGRVHIFDLKTRKFTVAGKCPSSNLCATEAPDGKVYMGGAKYSNFVVVDPEKGTSKFLGRMDSKEDYCSYLAVDKTGVVYAGIGTARANIIAYDPKTGKRTQLLPERLRRLGTGVVTAGKDGYVYVSFRSFLAKCLGGRIVETGVRCPEAQDIKNVKYQRSLKYFGDGSMVRYYDMGKREIGIQEVDGTLRKIKFNYVSGGLNLTSLAAGPDGDVYFSSSHPHHLGKLSLKDKKITDFGFNIRVGGGNFCNMTAFNGKLYACEYAGGRLWVYDPKLPVHYVDHRPVNFGVPFAELLKSAKLKNADLRALEQMRILFASSIDDNNEVVLSLKVPKAGRYFLNLQFLEAGSYGTVTVTAGKKQFVFNTQNDIRRSGKMNNLGPFDLEKGTFNVKFNLRANKNRDAKHYFGIIGIELAKNPRILPAPDNTIKPNPAILGTWPNLITRPRTIAVNPATDEVVISGFANYGLTGGGFGIWESKSGKVSEVSKWLPGESCIDMYFTEDGDLVGGTSIEAPGGGHEKATAASVFMMDWKSKKVIRSVKLPNVRHIYGVREFGKWIYAAAANGILYQIDKKSWKVVDQHDMAGRALIRNPLLKTADGKRLFLLQGRTISEVDPKSGKLNHIALTPWHLSTGGAIVGDRIYFTQRENVCSWKIGGGGK